MDLVRSFNLYSDYCLQLPTVSSNTWLVRIDYDADYVPCLAMAQLLNVELIVRGLPTLYNIRQIAPGSPFKLSSYTSKSVIHRGISEVQTGVAELSNGKDIQAVCKISRGDLSHLQHDATLYDDPKQLRTLQGSKVPLFFGYFECEVEQGPTTTAMGCIILEHCGQSISPEVVLQTNMN